MNDRLGRVAPGRTVEFAGFDVALDRGFREQLLAYGLAPGRPLTVLQQSPLTLVLCEHVELALETVVAELLWVRAPAAV